LIDRFCQRGTETSEMRAPVRIGDGIGEAKNLIVVAIVILQDAIDESLVALARDHDRLRMNNSFVLAELPHEFLDTVLVVERLLLRRRAAFVS
jgi:hypothetical protein